MIYIPDIPERVVRSSGADVLEDDPFLRSPTESSVNDSRQYLAPEFAAEGNLAI
jgi:hypothetical protein